LGSAGQVEAIALERNVLVTRPDGSVSARASGEPATIEPAGMVVHSIGYQALPIPGLPFEAASSVIPNLQGRVGKPGEIMPRCYVVGWIKRGPVGLLGSNKPDAKETVEHMLADRDTALAERAARTPGRVIELLVERGVRAVNFAEWHKLDALELARGAARGKQREKFASLEAMLAAL
jgi:ferredoxin--NADP+ reductase